MPTPPSVPPRVEYGKYLYLAARYRDHGCDDTDADYPFLVEDPALNALWVRLGARRSPRSRGELGDVRTPPPRPRRRSRSRRSRHFGTRAGACYVARDVRSGAHAAHTAVAGLIPLLIPGLPHAPELLSTLHGPRFALGQVHLVPSYDLTGSGFDPARYWRGPSWFNTAWLIVQALYAPGRSTPKRGRWPAGAWSSRWSTTSPST